MQPGLKSLEAAALCGKFAADAALSILHAGDCRYAAWASEWAVLLSVCVKYTWVWNHLPRRSPLQRTLQTANTLFRGMLAKLEHRRTVHYVGPRTLLALTTQADAVEAFYGCLHMCAGSHPGLTVDGVRADRLQCQRALFALIQHARSIVGTPAALCEEVTFDLDLDNRLDDLEVRLRASECALRIEEDV